MTAHDERRASRNAADDVAESLDRDAAAHERLLDETRRIHANWSGRAARGPLYWFMAIVSAFCLPLFGVGVVICYSHPAQQDAGSYLVLALLAAFPIAFTLLYQQPEWDKTSERQSSTSSSPAAEGIWSVWSVITTIVVVFAAVKWIGKTWFYQ